MADLTEPLLQDCETCGTSIDVTNEEPLALLNCPNCDAEMRVRRQFGSFELQEMLGAGGMGSVYRALDLNLHRHVALKLLRREYSTDPEFTRQFEHEAAITALINHPNVVKVYSSGSDHGLLYIAMELVDKGSLDDLMTRDERVPELQVLDVGIHIAQGLNAALQRGLIHRDVKPGNILFTNTQSAKIVDFGLAVPVDQAGTIGGEIWATPYYVAPEKLNDQPEDFRSDMYSLGATLFHAMAGSPPHDSEDASISALRQIKSKPVNLRAVAPTLSNATIYAIERSLQHDPGKRFQSYDEFIKHLEYAKAEIRKPKKTGGAAGPKSNVAKKPQNTNWTALGMAAAVVLGGVALFTFRDQIFSSQGAGGNGTQQSLSQAASFDEAYNAARTQLINGNAKEAAAAFRALETRTDLPEPLRSWAGFHAGMAWSFAGNLEEAGRDWRVLLTRGPFTENPEDQSLAEFFIETARRASSEDTHPGSIADEYSKVSYEPLALLALGAKNWTRGAFEEAGALFRAFVLSAPGGGNTWVGEYRPLASMYLSDLAAYKTIEEKTKAATTAELQKAVAPEVQRILSGMKLKGALKEQATELVTQLEQKLAAHAESETRLLAEQEAADAKLLGLAQSKSTLLAHQYKFGEARIALAGAAVTTEKGRKQQDALMKKTEWLSLFKTQLIRDLTVAGYPAPIQKKVGGQLTGVSRATENHVEIKTPYGSLPVPWSDITHESIIAMARAFLHPELPAEHLANRKWLLGVYMLFAGKETEGQALLSEAVQAKPEYQQLVPILSVTATE